MDAPFPGTPPHLEHPSGIQVWLTEPLGVVTWLSRPVRADMDMARFLATEVDDRLFGLRAGHERVMFLHDWHNLESYTTEVRKHLTDWGLRRRSDISTLVVVLGDRAGSITRMGISVASTALSLAGLELRLEDDIRESIRTRGIRPRT